MSDPSSIMPTPLITRIAQFLQSDEGKVQFWIAVAVVVVAHVAWTRYQAWHKTTTTTTAQHVSAAQQADIRRRRFERLQQQQQQQSITSSSSNDKPTRETTTTTTVSRMSRQGTIHGDDDDKSSTVSSAKESNSGEEEEEEGILPDSVVIPRSQPMGQRASTRMSSRSLLMQNHISAGVKPVPAAPAPKEVSKSKDKTKEDKAETTKKKKTVPRKTPVESLLSILRSLLKTSNNNNNMTALTSFYNHVQSTIPADATWEALTQQYWPAAVTARPLNYDSLHQALTWLHCMRDVIQYAAVTTAETQPFLQVCLNIVLRRDITQRIAQSLAQAADKRLTDQTQDSDDEFELGALFCEDYGHVTTNTMTAQSNNDNSIPTAIPVIDPLTELLQLLQPVDTVVSTRFLQDVAEMQPNLPRILLQMALDAIPRIDPCSNTMVILQEDKILPSLTGLANLVTLSPLAAKELHGLIAQQVRDSEAATANGVNGCQVEEHSVLRKLLPIAALSVPNLGQETPSQQRQERRVLSLFQKTLRQQVEHYPVGVFRKSNQTARQVMDDARRIMQQARDKCTVILKRVIKAESKQEGQRACLFRWLSLVLQTK